MENGAGKGLSLIHILSLSLTAKEGEIETVMLPEQRILLSDPITGAYDDSDFAVAGDFSLRLKSIFGLYDNFGSRISPLIRIDSKAGHGAGKPMSKILEEQADVYGFIMYNLNMKPKF